MQQTAPSIDEINIEPLLREAAQTYCGVNGMREEAFLRQAQERYPDCTIAQAVGFELLEIAAKAAGIEIATEAAEF